MLSVLYIVNIICDMGDVQRECIEEENIGKLLMLSMHKKPKTLN